MKWAICIAGAIGVAGWGSWALSEENPEQQKPSELESLRREVGQLVQQYYPDAVVSILHDEKSQTEKIHVDYNTQSFLMRFRGKDGQWQEPVWVRGPYVGGIWCDLTLLKGRYAGDVAGAEDGFTGAGPDFYSRLVAPYSKKLDRHLEAVVRYPGGTPPEFLKRFDALVKDFERYVGKPAE